MNDSTTAEPQNDVLQAMGVQVGEGDKQANAVASTELQEEAEAGALEASIFGPDAFPELMGARVRPFTFKVEHKGSTFFCVALPKDVQVRVAKQVARIERESGKAARRVQALAEAEIADLDAANEKALAVLREGEATAVEVARRRIELEEAIEARREALVEDGVACMGEAMAEVEKLFDEVLARCVRDWRDPRWKFTPPCNAQSLARALEFPDKAILARRFMNYSQSGETATDFLSPA